MTREEIMLWLEHLADRETDPKCREALETASWIVYGCPEDVVKSYSTIAAKTALARVLIAEGKSMDEVRRTLFALKEKEVKKNETN